MSWALVQLKDLIVAHYGKALKKEIRDENGSCYVYGSSGFVGNHSDLICDYPTIIIGRKGSVGKVIWAPEGGWIIDTAYYVEKKSKYSLDLRFLFYALSRANLSKRTITTSIPGLNRDDLYETKIPLPYPDDPEKSLKEQQRIAAILDKADGIRRKRQQAIELADEFLRSVFLDMFGDPVTNPKGWEVSRIDSLCRIVRGSSPRPKGDPRYYGGSVPRLMVADLTRDGKRVTPKIDSLTEEGAKKSRPTKSGTVVMAVSGNVGLTSVLAIDACIHDGFIAFNDLKEASILPDFLQELMTFLKSTHVNRQAGAIFQNLTTSQIKEMKIPLPPIAMQEQYLAISEKVSNLEKINNNDGLFNSLSQKAFKGEL